LALALGFVIVLDTGAARHSWAAGSALSEEPIPLKDPEELPSRTPPIIEIGPDCLGTGNMPRGIELPGGAVWTPSLWVFGDYRSGINYFDNGQDDEVLEWANRLDLFANLQLSGTERILLGMSPLRSNSSFSGYTFEPDDRDGFDNSLNADITTLFFEGEFGELFPNLDPEDTGSFDYGFAVGRQLIFFQEGMMFNDTIDSIGITRDTVIIPNTSVDTRLTALFGWDQIHRDDNQEDNDSFVVGLFSETDFRKSTTNLDVAYVISDESGGDDGLYVGASATQRIGLWNTSFRANASIAMEDESDAVSTGGLLFGEISKTLPYSEDVIYGNAFWGIDEYSSAARDDTAGGPLGRVGILFAAVGLGNYGAALSNRADDVAGGALGYQVFFNHNRTQLVFEVGGRKGTTSRIDDAAAIGARFQQAIGDRFVFQVDGFAALQEDRDEGLGLRAELLVRF
jgi:hypothetical protein